ncbi:MAG: hypothetical protein WB580_16925, partial [Candidatus Binataceae bacterium]
ANRQCKTCPLKVFLRGLKSFQLKQERDEAKHAENRRIVKSSVRHNCCSMQAASNSRVKKLDRRADLSE